MRERKAGRREGPNRGGGVVCVKGEGARRKEGGGGWRRAEEEQGKMERG